MKIIDLLNKIANGEEIPNKFKYKGYIFEYDKDIEAYKDENINPYYLDDYININHEYELNDEIEIIEEDKKIEKLDLIDDYTPYIQFRVTANKINEIIDYLNKRSGE